MVCATKSRLFKSAFCFAAADAFRNGIKGEAVGDGGQLNSVSGEAGSKDSAFSLPETLGESAGSRVDGAFYNNLTAGLRGEKTVDADGEAEVTVNDLSENVDENFEKDLENGQDVEYNKNKGSVDGSNENNGSNLSERIRQNVDADLIKALERFGLDIPEKIEISEEVQEWLKQGENTTIVYLGIDNNERSVYVGITKQPLKKRLNQHNNPNNSLGSKEFSDLVTVFEGDDRYLKRNMGRAIEEFLYVYGPNEKNLIHSIAPDSKNYDEKVLAGVYAVKKYLESRNIRRE